MLKLIELIGLVLLIVTALDPRLLHQMEQRRFLLDVVFGFPDHIIVTFSCIRVSSPNTLQVRVTVCNT